MRWTQLLSTVTLSGALMAATTTSAGAQSRQAVAPRTDAAAATGRAAGPAPAVEVPADFRIGPDDVLTISVYGQKDLTTDTTVRPDGKITLALINDVQAAGLRPMELREQLVQAYGQFVRDPTVTVQVKEIKSLKVFITGEVAKQGPYPLTEHMTVLNLISLAGGLLEYADKDHVMIIRVVNGKQTFLFFNYSDVLDRKPKALAGNIELKAGDQVVVK